MPGHAVRKVWLAYTGLLTFAIVIGELSNLARGEAFSFVAVANWVVTFALLTASWGYALQRPIATQQYWRRVVWILLLVNSLMLLRVGLAGTVALIVVLVMMAALVPAYIAAYLYAFRSPHLWQPESSRGAT